MAEKKEKKKTDPMELVNAQNEAAKRIEEANANTEELMNRQAQEKAEQQNEGESNAGEETQPISEEDKATADAKATLAGTGMEDMIQIYQKI